MASKANVVKAARAVCSPAAASHALPPTAGNPVGRRCSLRPRPPLAGIAPLFTTALALAIGFWAAVSPAPHAEALMAVLSRLCEHLSCVLIPRVQQPYGRSSIMQYPVVCVYTGQWGTQTWATRNGQRRVHFRRPASDFLTSSSSVVTRRSAQWRPNPRRPFLAHLLAPLTSLMPVRTPRQLVLAPHAWHPGAMAVLLTCRAAGWGGWTTSDSRAAASGLTRRAAVASSRITIEHGRGGQPMVGRRGLIVCVGADPPL